MQQSDGRLVDWRDRFKGVAEAQSYYLYLLGAAGVFFFALHLALPETPAAEVFGVPISPEFVWAIGPSVLGFLLAAALGSIKAQGHASARMELGRGEFEREDVRPNVLDMAFYTTVDSPRLALAFGELTYSTYLTLFLVEGAWLWWRLLQVSDRGAPMQVALVLGACMLLLGFARLPEFFWERVKRFWATLRGKDSSPTMSTARVLLTEAETMLRETGREVVTQCLDGRWSFVVDGSPVAVGGSLPELAVAVQRWFPGPSS